MNWTEYWKLDNWLERIVRWYKMSFGYRKFLEYIPEGSVLEVGCGQAHLSKLLKDREVVTLDSDPYVAPDVVGDVFHLPFEDNYFDVVMSTGLMEHFNSTEFIHAVNEQSRVGRTVVINMPAPCRLWRFIWKLRGIKLKHVLREEPWLSYLMAACDWPFKVHKVWFGPFPYWSIVCQKYS